MTDEVSALRRERAILIELDREHCHLLEAESQEAASKSFDRIQNLQIALFRLHAELRGDSLFEPPCDCILCVNPEPEPES